MVCPVAVVDYGLGNIHSVTRALKAVGGEVVVTDDPDQIAKASRIVLPGVGAFGEGMRALSKLGLVDALRAFLRSGNPLLGICLGMQLLMSESEEFGIHTGLDFIQGKVKSMQGPDPTCPFRKVPQIGWNRLRLPPGVDDFSCVQREAHPWSRTILSDVREGEFVYFLHSYVAIPGDSRDQIAETEYGGLRICAAVSHENIHGCQFHPEKSGEVGLRILRYFVHKL